MSCHDIGRGMAYVGSEVLRLYDEGKFDTDTAKRLLWATLKGVHWCDGNESEAAQSLDGRCAHCLRKVELPETELVFGDSREQNDRAASDFVWSLTARYWPHRSASLAWILYAKAAKKEF